MKSIIENLPSERELQQQKLTFELWGAKMKAGVSDVGSFITSIQTAYKNLDEMSSAKKSYGNSLSNVINKNQNVLSAVKDATSDAAYNQFKTGGILNTDISKDLSSLTYGSKDYNNAVTNYNSAIDAYSSLFEQLDMSHWEDYGIASKGSDGKVSFNADKFKSTYG